MASALLSLTDPERYGVIDFRVWTVLYEYGAVDRNPSGLNLSANNWLQYLELIRGYAKEFKVTPRDIDRTLFLHNRTDAGVGQHY